jgi:hypothetical protein
MIVAVQVGAVRIFVAAVEALKTKRKKGETQETMKIHGFLSFNANVLLCRFFLNLNPCMTKLGVLTLSFPDFTDISNI